MSCTLEKNDFLQNLEKNHVLKFGEFTLASGAKSDFYIDLRTIPYYPELFSTIMKQWADKIQSEADFDIVCGIPMAGMPFGTMISYFSKKPMIFIRKQSKGHGLNKLIEGGEVKGKKVLIVDDLVSSGFSKEFAINELRKEGAEVTHLSVLIDRRENDIEAVEWEKTNKVVVVSLFKLKTDEIYSYHKTSN